MLSGVFSVKAQRSKEHAFRYFQLKAASRSFCFHTRVHWCTYIHLRIRLFLFLYKVLFCSRARTSGGYRWGKKSSASAVSCRPSSTWKWKGDLENKTSLSQVCGIRGKVLQVKGGRRVALKCWWQLPAVAARKYTCESCGKCHQLVVCRLFGDVCCAFLFIRGAWEENSGKAGDFAGERFKELPTQTIGNQVSLLTIAISVERRSDSHFVFPLGIVPTFLMKWI